jgi:DNA-binding NarL/FixJ family response regulator
VSRRPEPLEPTTSALEWDAKGQLATVLLTASDDEADIDGAFAAGATSYLVKPVGFDALLDVVRTLGLPWMLLDEQLREGASGP